MTWQYSSVAGIVSLKAQPIGKHYSQSPLQDVKAIKHTEYKNLYCKSKTSIEKHSALQAGNQERSILKVGETQPDYGNS